VIHVLPINDIDEHEETTTCKCEPTVIKEGDEFIVVHNSFDGREGVEIVNDFLYQLLKQLNLVKKIYQFIHMFWVVF